MVMFAPLTAAPVKDRYGEYEYKLYQRATSLYPACPSDGYVTLLVACLTQKMGQVLTPTYN